MTSLLVEATLLSTVTVLTVGLLRPVVRSLIGSSSAYLLWLLVPACLLAILLPGQPVNLSSTAAAIGIAEAKQPVLVIVDAAASLYQGGLVLGLWSIGVIVTAAIFMAQQRRFSAQLGCLTARGPGRKLLQSEHSRPGPVAVGIWRPSIVVPADFFSRYNARERRLVLAHEHIHLNRLDPIWNLLCAVLRCLFWFNPIVHWASRLFRADQELACDEVMVDRFPNWRLSYGKALLKAQTAHLPVATLMQGFGTHPLTERMKRLTQRSVLHNHRRQGTHCIGLVIILAAILLWTAHPGARASYSEGELFLEIRILIDGEAHSTRIRSRELPPSQTLDMTGENPAVHDRVTFTHFDEQSDWSSNLSINRASLDSYLVMAVLRHSGEIVSSPKMTIDRSTPASIEVNGRDRSVYRIEIVPERR